VSIVWWKHSKGEDSYNRVIEKREIGGEKTNKKTAFRDKTHSKKKSVNIPHSVPAQ
jgi:hypothetical protein